MDIRIKKSGLIFIHSKVPSSAHINYPTVQLSITADTYDVTLCLLLTWLGIYLSIMGVIDSTNLIAIVITTRNIPNLRNSNNLIKGPDILAQLKKS